MSWKVLIGEILTTVEESPKPQKYHIDLLRDCLDGNMTVNNPKARLACADPACGLQELDRFQIVEHILMQTVYASIFYLPSSLK